MIGVTDVTDVNDMTDVTNVTDDVTGVTEETDVTHVTDLTDMTADPSCSAAALPLSPSRSYSRFPSHSIHSPRGLRAGLGQ